LEIRPPQVSRFPQPFAPAFRAGEHWPRSVATTQPQARPRANAHDPATGPSGFPTASWRLVPSRFCRPLSPISARTRTREGRTAGRCARPSCSLEALPNLRSETWPAMPHGSLFFPPYIEAFARSRATLSRDLARRSYGQCPWVFLAILTNASRSRSEGVCYALMLKGV